MKSYPSNFQVSNFKLPNVRMSRSSIITHSNLKLIIKAIPLYFPFNKNHKNKDLQFKQ